MQSGQLRHEPPVVVTSCTARKRSREQAVSGAEVQRATSVSDLAHRWVRLALRQPTVASAGTLYGGRSFREAAAAADACQGELFIVSAGFGLVENTAALPNYALTISAGDGSIAATLAKFNASAADWWRALCLELGGPDPLRRLLERATGAPAMLALPSTYLRMVESELNELSARELSRLRLFTSPAGERELKPRLAACVLPYDERLNEVDGYAGTRTDFAQRALRHFVEALRGHRLPLRDGKAAVLHTLNMYQPTVRPARARLTDDEICSAIKSIAGSDACSATPLLRRLRDEKKIACEQRRFRSLWQRVQQEREAEEAR